MKWYHVLLLCFTCMALEAQLQRLADNLDPHSWRHLAMECAADLQMDLETMKFDKELIHKLQTGHVITSPTFTGPAK